MHVQEWFCAELLQSFIFHLIQHLYTWITMSHYQGMQKLQAIQVMKDYPLDMHV